MESVVHPVLLEMCLYIICMINFLSLKVLSPPKASWQWLSDFECLILFALRCAPPHFLLN